MGMVKQWSYHIDEVDEGYTPHRRCISGKLEDGNDITLGHPEEWSWTTATDEQLDRAMQMLNDLWMDQNLGTPGRRNNDAVNLCIVLYILGCDSPDKWASHMQDFHVIKSLDHLPFMEHIERVCEYLTKWFPGNDMGQGFDYILY